MRGGKLISLNNFSAQEHASSKNGHILNFRVMGMLEIKLLSCLLKISEFLAFLEVKVSGKVLI